MLLYDKEYCTIIFDRTNKIVIQTWKGFANYEEFVDAINTTVNFFKQDNGAKYIISNVLNARPATKDSIEYTTNIANPLLVQNGLIAIIFVKKKIGNVKISVNHFKIGSHNLLICEVFNIESAYKKIKKLEVSGDFK